MHLRIASTLPTSISNVAPLENEHVRRSTPTRNAPPIAFLMDRSSDVNIHNFHSLSLSTPMRSYTEPMNGNEYALLDIVPFASDIAPAPPPSSPAARTSSPISRPLSHDMTDTQKASTNEANSYYDDDNTMQTPLNDDESVTSTLTGTSFDTQTHGGGGGGVGAPKRSADPIDDLISVPFLSEQAIMRQYPELRNVIDDIVRMNETIVREDESTSNQLQTINKQTREARDVYEETIDAEELKFAIDLLELSEPELVLIMQMRDAQQKAAAVEHQRQVQAAIAQMSEDELRCIDEEIYERVRIQVAAWQRQSIATDAQLHTTNDNSNTNTGVTPPTC